LQNQYNELKRSIQERSAINLCVCTSLSLDFSSGGKDRIVKFARNVSKYSVNVFLIDRSREKSLSAMILDKDKYIELKNGRSRSYCYPLYMRFLFAGMIKFFQEAFNLWFALLTRTPGSEVSYSYLLDPYLVVKLLFVCKREKIDVIQCEFPFTTFVSFIVKKVTGIPLVYDAHNIESERIGGMENVSKLHVALMRRIEIVSCNIGDSVFVVSENDRARLLSWGIPEYKVTVIPNSVELEEFSLSTDGCRIRERYSLRDKFVVIFHGFLSYPPNREATKILVNLLPSILEKHDSVRLLLVGKNPPKISNPNVIVTGFVETIPEYIAAADLAVVPLLSGGGTKIKMLEYMACGKAIVSTIKAAEGLNLKNGTDILMAEHPDSQFIDLVLKLIEDDDLRVEIGRNALEKVKLFYDWKKNAKKAVDIYGNLIQKKKAYITG
jgi:glycosyltransferase involved in cell wall biosynthesis